MKNNIIKNILLFFFLGSLIVIAGCSSNANFETNKVKNNSTSNFNTKIINIEAFQFGFKPNIIKVNYGDKIILNAKSLDVPHGIAIEGYPNVNLYLDGINGDSVTFIANKKGTFTFYCSVPCGEGHGNMIGTFIVK